MLQPYHPGGFNQYIVPPAVKLDFWVTFSGQAEFSEGVWEWLTAKNHKMDWYVCKMGNTIGYALWCCGLGRYYNKEKKYPCVCGHNIHRKWKQTKPNHFQTLKEINNV